MPTFDDSLRAFCPIRKVKRRVAAAAIESMEAIWSVHLNSLNFGSFRPVAARKVLQFVCCCCVLLMFSRVVVVSLTGSNPSSDSFRVCFHRLNLGGYEDGFEGIDRVRSISSEAFRGNRCFLEKHTRCGVDHICPSQVDRIGIDNPSRLILRLRRTIILCR